MSYLMILKCALAIWLRPLTVEISYVPSTGEVVSFRRENWKPFDVFEMHHREKLRKCKHF